MSRAYVDDSDMSEITILPDGRIYVFGISERLYEVMHLFEQEGLPGADGQIGTGEARETDNGGDAGVDVRL